MIMLFSIFFSLLVLSVYAHQQPGVRPPQGLSCTDAIPPFQSYHIHILFWQNNANSTRAAEILLQNFMKHFDLNESNACKVF